MQRFLNGPFSTGVEMSARVLVVSNDGRLLFSGGHWDCSLRVTQLGKGKLVGRICRHIGENFWLRSRRQTLPQHGSFLLLYLSHRRGYVLGSGSLWHLPHLWIEGHILYRVEGSPAGKHHLISSSLHLAHTLCHQSYRFIDRQGGFSSGLSPRPVQVLCGHDQEVTCVAISTELDMAVSGSKVRSTSFQNMKYPQGLYRFLF